jgi:hypothetical protein
MAALVKEEATREKMEEQATAHESTREEQPRVKAKPKRKRASPRVKAKPKRKRASPSVRCNFTEKQQDCLKRWLREHLHDPYPTAEVLLHRARATTHATHDRTSKSWLPAPGCPSIKCSTGSSTRGRERSNA